MSVFSLSRMRFARPSPPFQLGGELRLHSGRVWLGDGVGELEVLGLPNGADFRHGDLIVVDVIRASERCIECAKFASTMKAGGERRPLSPHIAGFSRFMRQVREFFVARGLLEVHTPSLVICPGMEPSLEPFSVEVQKGRDARTVYLPTSPEIHLKKAMAAGFTDVFEMKSCFRKGEFSPHHENEFTMLEWYRGFADLEMIREDLIDLLHFVGAGVSEVRVTTFAELFAELLDFKLTPETTHEEMRVLAAQLSLHFQAEDTFNDLFHRVMIEKIEPRLEAMGPTIVRDFPPSQAALARLTKTGWADRFELYWNGLEIANAFNEVTDAEEQQRRWEHESAERQHLGTSPVPSDEDLIKALRVGIPFSGGIALGVERLYMAIHQVKDIRELKIFSSDDLFADLRRSR